jgi:hypothetical protein
MTTLESDINDLFLSRVDDYRINTIFSTSGSAGLNTYLEPYLLDSIVEFDICDQTLNYTPTSGSVEGSFDTTLSLKNKIVLSRLMVRYWLTKTVNNVLQMGLALQDHDFKRYAESQNLKAKQDYLNSVKEELDVMLGKYGLANVNWANWQNQIFN